MIGPLVEAPLAHALQTMPHATTALRVLTASSAEVSRLVKRGEASLGVRYFDDDDSLVEVGLGVALLPESSVREELARGTLVKLDLPRMATEIEVHLVRRRDGYLSPAARTVITLLERAFAPRPL